VTVPGSGTSPGAGTGSSGDPFLPGQLPGGAEGGSGSAIPPGIQGRIPPGAEGEIPPGAEGGQVPGGGRIPEGVGGETDSPTAPVSTLSPAEMSDGSDIPFIALAVAVLAALAGLGFAWYRDPSLAWLTDRLWWLPSWRMPTWRWWPRA
jgi:hypothetical protein